MTQRVKETKEARRERMDKRRVEQADRVVSRTARMSRRIADFVEAMRSINARNGVGRPPRNKVWPKGHPKRDK